tara:strand:+ start:365 stop:751 length:387 start_codon:yes stop_codon:yes gene_type:complete
MAMKSHGAHVMLDYTGFFSKEENLGEWMLNLIETAVDQSTARRVHSHTEEFDGIKSPPGFAAVVLLDESHVSAHCYSDKGWLALDCFTCGNTDPNTIADIIHNKLEQEISELKLVNRTQQSRFMHERV